ncbi:MAG: D-alanyl-D-alanine carboxypeptidase/D-alanyl-D-alanine-endopeptidase [Actinomycetia bacterium]|nr:D-alanyl-D-alanine carboxypeptidase/D-alanyl-D-alanine-endopeptidase [Actinomycetes bacterium]
MHINGTQMAKRVGIAVGTFSLALGLLAVPLQVLAAPPSGPVPSVYRPLSSTALVPSITGLDRSVGRLTQSPTLGKFSMLVVDPVTEKPVFSDQVNKARIPASVTKILTAAATLSSLGPNSRLSTRTTLNGSDLYLIGGGDPLMTKAKGINSLKSLALKTISSLKSRNVTSVKLFYDASLFTGPTLGPGWKSSFPKVGVAAPVSALSVGGARVQAGSVARVADPARQAGQLFAKRLKKLGIKVTSVKSGIAPSSASRLASVSSEPVSVIVEEMLRDSDNDVAEILSHLVGKKTVGEGSFEGGARATKLILSQSGVSTVGLSIFDGSGLSRQNKVTSETVADVLTEMVRGDQPQWAAIATGLPVAGRTGTLDSRFDTKKTKAGAGVVRAKTGSLTGVSALAGTVLDKSGRLLVFVMMGNKVGSITNARDSMDLLAAKLAKCGCQ